MIRFIIRRKILDRYSELQSELFETIDCTVSELERALLSGGSGQSSYDYRELVGVEVLPEEPK